LIIDAIIIDIDIIDIIADAIIIDYYYYAILLLPLLDISHYY
jgi:hypothetical protein